MMLMEMLRLEYCVEVSQCKWSCESSCLIINLWLAELSWQLLIFPRHCFILQVNPSLHNVWNLISSTTYLHLPLLSTLDCRTKGQGGAIRCCHFVWNCHRFCGLYFYDFFRWTFTVQLSNTFLGLDPVCKNRQQPRPRERTQVGAETVSYVLVSQPEYQEQYQLPRFIITHLFRQFKVELFFHGLHLKMFRFLL